MGSIGGGAPVTGGGMDGGIVKLPGANAKG